MIWLVAAILSIATGAAILWRLYPRGGSETAPAAEAAEYDLEIYRDQLRELGRDVARGTIDAAEAEAARNEIRRRALAAESREEAEKSGAPQTLSRPTVLLLAAAVAATAGGLVKGKARPRRAVSRPVRRPPAAARVPWRAGIWRIGAESGLIGWNLAVGVS